MTANCNLRGQIDARILACRIPLSNVPFVGLLAFLQEIDVKAGGGHAITMGEMLRQFLTKLEWYSTLFPRIPVPIQKDIQRKMQVSNEKYGKVSPSL